MTNYSTLASNMKRRIIRFSERIAKGLNRPVYKFVSQMITGMLSSQSCHLSKIARTLGEPISLKKTIDRLSRNLSSFDKGAHLQENYIQQVRACLNDRSILVVDDGDITKPCSTKLEGLCKVRDGSTGEIGVGYHMYEVTALTPGQGTPISVYSRVFSTEEEGFVSADMAISTSDIRGQELLAQILKILSFLYKISRWFLIIITCR